MVVNEADHLSQAEVESALQSDHHDQSENHTFPSLGRQSSIYSLTLDEFQHTLSDGGKNFGSMNMDEFLNNIWTAEENQAHANSHAATTTTPPMAVTNTHFPQGECTSTENNLIAKQSSLPRQGSLTLPAPLCRKTVDEVWSEIHKTQKDQRHNNNNNSSNNIQNLGSTPRQPTFGEMTLEDFLVKAGVVREQGHLPVLSLTQPYGLYQNNTNPSAGPSFITRPIVAYPPPISQNGVGEAPLFLGCGKRSGGHQTPAVYTGGSGGGYGAVQGLGLGSPVSPVSSDGMGGNQVDSVNQYMLEIGGVRGVRKRIMDGPVEKVVERRQKRMIKNRESAARSRARKQVYVLNWPV